MEAVPTLFDAGYLTQQQMEEVLKHDPERKRKFTEELKSMITLAKQIMKLEELVPSRHAHDANHDGTDTAFQYAMFVDVEEKVEFGLNIFLKDKVYRKQVMNVAVALMWCNIHAKTHWKLQDDGSYQFQNQKEHARLTSDVFDVSIEVHEYEEFMKRVFEPCFSKHTVIVYPQVACFDKLTRREGLMFADTIVSPNREYFKTLVNAWTGDSVSMEDLWSKTWVGGAV